MGPKPLKISAGLRIGFWDNAATQWTGGPFQPKGIYLGPDIGEFLPGAKIEQKLIEGILKFKVGVLFRPDLGKRQCLETILIIEEYIPEMFDYETWEAV